MHEATEKDASKALERERGGGVLLGGDVTYVMVTPSDENRKALFRKAETVRELEDEMRRIDQFKDECRRKWEEQGKQKKNVERCGLKPSPIGEQRGKLKSGALQNWIPC